jgi:hypothetical protein
MDALLEDNSVNVLRSVLPDALQRTFAELRAEEAKQSLAPSVVRDSWIRCLRDAFSNYYINHNGTKNIAVIGGKPRPNERNSAGVPTGIPQWARWEFLHDIAVVEWECALAAYARAINDPLQPRQIPIVTRALRQVESEIAGNGTQVAEDISKLVISSGANKLLVASYTRQYDERPWLEFLVRSMSRIDGDSFVALVPNYGAALGYGWWKAQTATACLYKCHFGSHELQRSF